MSRLVLVVYRAAAYLLPAEFRRANQAELEALYQEALERAARRGRWAWCLAVLRGLWDVLGEAVRIRTTRTRLPRRRNARRTNKVEATLQDLRLAARSLAKSPGFVLTAVAMIALGIGANTALFSVINAVLLRPPPGVERPDRLVTVYTSDFSGPAYGASSLPDFFDFRDQTSVFSDASPVQPGIASVPAGGGVSERLVSEYVGGDYFQLLGVQMARGRAFSSEEGDPASGAAVVVLSHGFWTRRFGADPDVIGRVLTVSGHPLTIVGVAPVRFGGITPLVTPDLWMPLSSYALIEGSTRVERRDSRGWLIVARLREGATGEGAQQQLSALTGRLRTSYPQAWVDVNDATRRVTVVPDVGLPPQARGVAFGFAALLLAVFIVTLLIACANIANLTLARAVRRKPEVALKVALGASRMRILRQLLAESAVIGVVGGLVGALIGLLLTGAARSLPPIAGVDLAVDVSADRMVLLFSALLTVLTIFAVGLMPALGASRADPGRALKGERSEGKGPLRWFQLRGLLVIGQVAASLVLLVGAGLTLKSVRAAVQIDPGFDVNDVATLSMSLRPEGYTPEQALDLFRELAARAARMPGVEAVSYADVLPMTPAAQRRRGASIPGYEPGPGEDMEFQFHAVAPGFLDALGMQLIQGRDVAASDDATSPRVVLVNESFASRFWPGEDPIGKLVSWGRRDAQVVGLVQDALYRNLQDVGRPAFFAPVAQSPSTTLTLVARTAPGGARRLLPLLRDEAARLDDRAPIGVLQTMEDAVATVLLPQRVASWLLSIAGVLGMLLGAAGLYGVMSFLVSQRTREIGLRMALGAKTRDVVGRIVRRGVLLSAVGVGIGLVVAAGVTRLMRSLLVDVSPLDFGVFSVMAIAALIVAALASWVPARRAAAVDPMVALRLE